MIKTIIVLLLLFASINPIFSQQFSGGSGTQSDPYLISNIDDWLELTNIVNTNDGSMGGDLPGSNWSNNKFFEITQDITDTVRIPVGHNFLYILNIKSWS